MTMITPSYLGETIEYSSLHACRSTLEDPTNSALWILFFIFSSDMYPPGGTTPSDKCPRFLVHYTPTSSTGGKMPSCQPCFRVFQLFIWQGFRRAFSPTNPADSAHMETACQGWNPSGGGAALTSCFHVRGDAF